MQTQSLQQDHAEPRSLLVVGNADCASTCAMFSTLMFERHATKIAIFGGKPGLPMEYKGMAGNQVLEWSDLDTEIKTANQKNVSPVFVNAAGSVSLTRVSSNLGRPQICEQP